MRILLGLIAGVLVLVVVALALALGSGEAGAAPDVATAATGGDYGPEPADIFTNAEVGDALPYTEHWPDGSLKEKGFAFAGSEGRVLHGPYQQWHPTGELASEGHWRHGRRHGAWHFWHPGGQQRLEGVFVEGQLDRTRFWVERDADGRWVDGHVAAARAAGVTLEGDGTL